MKLSVIMGGVNFIPEDKTVADVEISGISIDSRHVKAGGLFICIRGTQTDGHAFIADAVKNGAECIVCEYLPEGADPSIPVLIVEDTRASLGRIASNFYGHPEKHVKVIGVTGTKGKTSTTYYLHEILRAAGFEAGVIGTTGAFAGGREIPVKFQTSSMPDTIELYQILSIMAQYGVQYAVMEASSHGLSQNRAGGITFSVGIFSNLSHDHLDYHGTLENYARAKALLLRQCKRAVVNIDDVMHGIITENSACPVKYYGIAQNCDYHAENLTLSGDGVVFDVNVSGVMHSFSLNVPGRFSAYNALAAVAAACELGVPADAIALGLKRVTGVPGRLERVPNTIGANVFVDYAHSPASIENVLTAVREFTKGRVIIVFGCGGDRDKTKRPVMGKIAASLSDFCIITSDNPRNENPADILAEIRPGAVEGGRPFEIEADRETAIRKAVLMAEPGDSVVIAGKGHETYQEFENGRRIFFDDRVTAREALRSNPAL